MAIIAGLLTCSVLARSAAEAGCDKDSDCKGTRICENGVCVGAAPEAPVTRARVTLDPKAAAVGKARRRAIASLALGPLAVIGAAVTMGLGVAVNDEDDLWSALFASQLVSLAAATSSYGTGLHGSLIARRERASDSPPALLISGITVGGFGLLGLLGTTLASAGLGDDINNGDGALIVGWFGGLSALLAGGGSILLGVDALLNANELVTEVEVAGAAEWWLSPIAVEGGAGMQLLARF